MPSFLNGIMDIANLEITDLFPNIDEMSVLLNNVSVIFVGKQQQDFNWFLDRWLFFLCRSCSEKGGKSKPVQKYGLSLESILNKKTCQTKTP